MNEYKEQLTVNGIQTINVKPGVSLTIYRLLFAKGRLNIFLGKGASLFIVRPTGPASRFITHTTVNGHPISWDPASKRVTPYRQEPGLFGSVWFAAKLLFSSIRTFWVDKLGTRRDNEGK